MDEPHSHRSLPDCRGATFDGSGADVAGGEDAGYVRLEEPGGSRCVAGEDESVVVPRDGFTEPFGARSRSEEEEQEREAEAFTAGKRDCLEDSLGAVEFCDLAQSRTAMP